MVNQIWQSVDAILEQVHVTKQLFGTKILI